MSFIGEGFVGTVTTWVGSPSTNRRTQGSSYSLANSKNIFEGIDPLSAVDSYPLPDLPVQAQYSISLFPEAIIFR
jgi:hypothetical protein